LTDRVEDSVAIDKEHVQRQIRPAIVYLQKMVSAPACLLEGTVTLGGPFHKNKLNPLGGPFHKNKLNPLGGIFHNNKLNSLLGGMFHNNNKLNRHSEPSSGQPCNLVCSLHKYAIGWCAMRLQRADNALHDSRTPMRFPPSVRSRCTWKRQLLGKERATNQWKSGLDDVDQIGR
jgi:hypothetical protein